mmetsp:Transcript_21471/g.28242  ORF Transcript_21471/g.28242 Transcript_21471/m.28242 type:complete len:208 (-) Transcript_21471:294-917(-)
MKVSAVSLLLIVSLATPLAEAFHPAATTRTWISSPISSTTPSSSLYAIANPLKKKDAKPKHGRDIVLRVESIEEYKNLVVDEKERITVVRFYAKWCKMCRASEPFFYKLAADFHAAHKVNFVEVPLNKRTTVLHQALGVPSLPWTHIYHPDAGLVEERTVNKKHIDEVRQCLRCYVYGECDLDDVPASCENLYGECEIEDDPTEVET